MDKEKVRSKTGKQILLIDIQIPYIDFNYNNTNSGKNQDNRILMDPLDNTAPSPIPAPFDRIPAHPYNMILCRIPCDGPPQQKFRHYQGYFMVQTITIRAAAAVFILSAILTGAVSCRVMENILNPADLVIAVTNAPDYDVVPPVLDSFWPAEGAVSEKLIGGAVSDTKSGVSNVTLTITSLDRSKTWNTSVTAVFSNTFDLPFGHYYYQVSAIDKAGNSTNFPERLAFFLTTNKIVAPDASLGMHFGYAVALSDDGNTLVSGAPNANGGKGAIYIAQWSGSTWIITKITNNDNSLTDAFGKCVTVSGDGHIVAAGAPNHNNGKGAVYVYRWNGSVWLTNKISAYDAVNNDLFGSSLSLSSDGNHIACGAEFDDAMGSVYLLSWTNSNWITNKFTAFDREVNDYFGTSVSLTSNGQSLAVASPNCNSYLGAIYLFQKNGPGWITNKIRGSDAASSEGHASVIQLSQDGNYMLTSSYSDFINGTNLGSAYLFNWNGTAWSEQKFVPFTGTNDMYYGQSAVLSCDGKKLVIGAPTDSRGFIHSGSVFLSEKDSDFYRVTLIEAYDKKINAQFGFSLSMTFSGNILAIGSYNDNNTGAVYIIK